MFGTNISIRSVNWIGKSNQDPTWKKILNHRKIFKINEDKEGQSRSKKDKPQHCQRGSAENREKIGNFKVSTLTTKDYMIFLIRSLL